MNKYLYLDGTMVKSDSEFISWYIAIVILIALGLGVVVGAIVLSIAMLPLLAAVGLLVLVVKCYDGLKSIGRKTGKNKSK